jgi:HD-GYP domain
MKEKPAPVAPDGAPPASRPGRPSLSQVLSALSRALDLAGGQAPGHALRCAAVGMRLGREIGLADAQLVALHYALLLKDAGRPWDAGQAAVAAPPPPASWSRVVASAHRVLAGTLPGPAAAVATRPRSAPPQEGADRGERGAHIIRALGLGEETAQALLAVHYPGEDAAAAPVLTRIVELARFLERFGWAYTARGALEVAQTRADFDRELVRAAGAFLAEGEFWGEVCARPQEALSALSPEATRVQAAEADIDAVCDVFAMIVDDKSSFTAAHSTRVCGYALALADAFDIRGERRADLRRAALLHDLGKVGIPADLLDKPGPLSTAEFRIVQRHPQGTEQILQGLPGFERVSAIAAAHHEKLDGSGYFRGLTGERMDREMRLLVVADMYDALTTDRPYRRALTPEKAFRVLERDAGTALDADCVAALKGACRAAVLPPVETVRPAAAPAALAFA